MNSSAFCSLFFTLSLILISNSPLQANARKGASKQGKLIASVCKDAMRYRAECMRVLKSDPKISSSKNYLDLSKNLIEFAIKRGTEGQNFLRKVLKTNPASPALAQCANDCYGGIVGSFRSSLRELEVDDPMTANYDAKVAGDYPDTCDTALAEEHIKNPAVTALNREINLLSQFAYLATNHLCEGL